jgi:hypothetical protein
MEPSRAARLIATRTHFPQRQTRSRWPSRFFSLNSCSSSCDVVDGAVSTSDGLRRPSAGSHGAVGESVSSSTSLWWRFVFFMLLQGFRREIKNGKIHDQVYSEWPVSEAGGRHGFIWINISTDVIVPGDKCQGFLGNMTDIVPTCRRSFYPGRRSREIEITVIYGTGIYPGRRSVRPA